VLPGQVSESTLHAVADHGVTHRLADHEADAGTGDAKCGVHPDSEVNDHGSTSGPPADAHGLLERSAVSETVIRWQHVRGLGGGSCRQTARLLRPLRRREARIERPARVRIRRRKPCTLCRRRLFGWYVRLLTSFSPYWFRAATSGRDGSA